MSIMLMVGRMKTMELKLSSEKVFWFQCFPQITLYVPGVQKLQSCRKFGSLVFFPEKNLALNVWFAPQFNTEHCTVPHDLLYCVIKSNQIPQITVYYTYTITYQYMFTISYKYRVFRETCQTKCCHLLFYSIYILRYIYIYARFSF